MNHAAMLEQARTDGLKITLTLEGEITARGPQPAIEQWTPILRLHKPAIVALLKADAEPVAVWDAGDWQTYFHERAAVAEFDGMIPRPPAEHQAYLCCIAEWLCQHPVTPAPGQCAWCGRGETERLPVRPYGDETHGHTWLHGECWAAWHAQRRQIAIAALEAMGIREGGMHHDQRTD